MTLSTLKQTFKDAGAALAGLWPRKPAAPEETKVETEASPSDFAMTVVSERGEKAIRLRLSQEEARAEASDDGVRVTGDAIVFDLPSGVERRLRAVGPTGRRTPLGSHFRWLGGERFRLQRPGNDNVPPACRVRLSLFSLDGKPLLKRVAKLSGETLFDFTLPPVPGRAILSIVLSGEGTLRPPRFLLTLEGGITARLVEIDAVIRSSGGEALEPKLRALRDEFPASPQIRLRLIKALRRAHRLKEALAEIDGAREAGLFVDDPALALLEDDYRLLHADHGTGDQDAADGELALALSDEAGEERSRAQRWSDYLEMGLEEGALEKLASLARDAATRTVRSSAAWHLCRWHFLSSEPQAADEALGWWTLQRETGINVPAASWVGVEILTRLGRLDEAEALLTGAMERNPGANLDLAAANLAMRKGLTVQSLTSLEWLNRVFERWNLAPVVLPEADATLDDLSAEVEAAAGDDALVSVVVPVFNAEGSLPAALRSLQHQSWRNLDVVVVDDCSTDGSRRVAEAFCRADGRFRLLVTAENRGAYFSRNRGLEAAKGVLVTCHDADDWAHPQRVEIQARDLLAHEGRIANLSRCMTATPELSFRPRGRLLNALRVNYSSLMFRREPVLEAVGFWDDVRFGADGEFLARLRRAFGASAVYKMPSGPLSVVRQSADSLTGHASMGLSTPGWTLRKLYRERFEIWHDASTPEARRIARLPDRRPFPVPAALRRRGVSPEVHFDVLLASDFRLKGGTTASNQQEITAQARAGLRTGLLQLYSPILHPESPVSTKIMALIDDESVRFATVDQAVSADVAVIRWPPAVANMQSSLPRLDVKTLVMVCNQTPLRGGVGSEVIYDPAACDRTAERIFGLKPVWHPIGPEARRGIEPFASSIRIAATDWVNIVDFDAASSARTRGARVSGRQPVIGRHARDFSGKWPLSRDTLLAIYPENSEFEVSILGGAAVARQIIGYIPGNWTVHPFDSIAVSDYLAGLDVFVYFPDDSMNEAFGRTVLEAMAAGVPTLLPPRFRPAFGDAALYAPPADALDVVRRLVAEPDSHAAQAAKGRLFAAAHSFERHLNRLADLTGSDGAPLPRP